MRIEGSFGFGQQGYTVHWDKPKTNGSGPAGREKDNDTTDEALEAKPTTHGNQQGREEHGSIHSWDDPDWSILDDRRGDLPEFPIDTLPVPCQEWVERAAHGAGATPALEYLIFNHLSSNDFEFSYGRRGRSPPADANSPSGL